MNNVFLDSRCDLARRNANECLYENTWNTIQPDTQNINLLGTFNAKLSDNWNASLTGSWFNSEARDNRRPFAVPAGQPLTTPRAAESESDPEDGIPVFRVGANYPGNTFGTTANRARARPRYRPTSTPSSTPRPRASSGI